MLIRAGIRCRALPGLLDFRVCAAGQGPAWDPGFSPILYTLQNRNLLEFLDFCVYAAGQWPAWDPGILRIRCWAGPCLGSWIFAYTVYAAKQKPARVPEFCVYAAKQKPPQVPGFCVYAAGQKPAWIPGFCVYATEQKPARVPGFLRIQLGRALPELLDFRVYAAEHRLADDSNKLQASV